MIGNKKLYLIKWLDSYMHPSWWEDRDKIKNPVNMVCASVGWIEKETKDNITILPHISNITDKNYKGQGCGIMTIPKASILERIKIKI